MKPNVCGGCECVELRPMAEAGLLSCMFCGAVWRWDSLEGSLEQLTAYAGDLVRVLTDEQLDAELAGVSDKGVSS